jgi:hypothetical protein
LLQQYNADVATYATVPITQGGPYEGVKPYFGHLPIAGGLGADAITDYFADPTVGPNTYSIASGGPATLGFCNPALAVQGLHPTDLGMTYFGAVQAKVLKQLLGLP